MVAPPQTTPPPPTAAAPGTPLARTFINSKESIARAVPAVSPELYESYCQSCTSRIARAVRVALPELYESYLQSCTSRIVRAVRVALPELYESYRQSCTSRIARAVQAVLPELYQPFCQSCTSRIARAVQAFGVWNRMVLSWYSELTYTGTRPLFFIYFIFDIVLYMFFIQSYPTYLSYELSWNFSFGVHSSRSIRLNIESLKGKHLKK